MLRCTVARPGRILPDGVNPTNANVFPPPRRPATLGGLSSRYPSTICGSSRIPQISARPWSAPRVSSPDLLRKAFASQNFRRRNRPQRAANLWIRPELVVAHGLPHYRPSAATPPTGSTRPNLLSARRPRPTQLGRARDERLEVGSRRQAAQHHLVTRSGA